ncbi:MAG: ribosome silencing factor [Myxococcaceae bacterium]|nr:ribosome silencing factor [Myxococcaceae bacterium]
MAPPKKKKKASPSRGGKPAGKKFKLKKPARKVAGPKAHKPKRARKAPQRTAQPVVDNPEGLKLAREAANEVVEKKGLDVTLIDVRGKASYADYIVIASADSDRGLSSLAESIEARLKPQGHQVVSREGTDGGQWVLLDYSDVVIHLFHVDVRGFYDLEGLWADAPRLTVS